MILDKNVISTKNTFCVFQIPCKTPKTIVSVWWTNAKGQTSQFCLQGAKPWKSFLLVHSFNDLHCICLKTDKLKGLEYKAFRKPFDMCDKILGPPLGRKDFWLSRFPAKPKVKFCVWWKMPKDKNNNFACKENTVFAQRTRTCATPC